MNFPLTPEQQEWLDRISPAEARKEKRSRPVKQATAIEPSPFTDTEIAWLWPRFQKCSHRSYSFAKSFAKTPLDRLTPKGKACLHEVAYPYRRQIFKDGGGLSKEDFIAAVKRATSRVM